MAWAHCRLACVRRTSVIEKASQDCELTQNVTYCPAKSSRAMSSFLLVDPNVTLPGLFLCHHFQVSFFAITIASRELRSRAASYELLFTGHIHTAAQRIKSLTNSPSLPGSSGILQVGSENK